MALYVPPKEDLPIFDDLMFVNQTDAVTIEYANSHYLRYPNAQGTENLLNTNVNGLLAVNGTTTIQSQAPMGYSQFNITNTNGNYQLITKLNDNPGNGNPIIEFGDIVIQSVGEDLMLTTTSPTSSGVNVSANETMIGSGGTGIVPTSSLVCNGNTSTVTINNPTPAVYGPTTVQPAATDSSTNIPSTAWVQSALTASKLQTIQVYNTNIQTTFNSFGFRIQNPSTINSNDFFTMRVSVSMPWQASGGNYQQIANYDGIIDIYPNWVLLNGQQQSSYTQFCTNPAAAPLPGSYMGFDPIGNRYYAINTGTVNNTFNPPRWLTATSLSGQIGSNTAFYIGGSLATWSYPSVAGTWLENRWAWSHPSNSSGSMMYSSVVGSNTVPFFQILPTYVNGQGAFIQFMFYNPQQFYSTNWQPNTGNYFDVSCTVEILNKNVYTLDSFTDFGKVAGVSQWTTIVNNL